MPMFWLMNLLLLIGAIATWKHTPKPASRGVTFLNRGQTEEWKGWMQWAFIMYHYYRAWSAYNWIRVFVSSYVWMTGFGNFLYFDKTKDYSFSRVLSMFIRINYFPLLLCFVNSVPLELYYVVPLHTEGFFMTMITCYIAHKLQTSHGMSYYKANIAAILISLLAHVLFFETSAVEFLKVFSDEYHFRFQADKYSAWSGIVFGLLYKKINEYLNWVYNSETSNNPVLEGNMYKIQIAQRILGFSLILFWYMAFGYIDDKYTYNPIHPFIFILATTGWLLLRNSSKWLTECHSTFLEFLGKNTLETYVLQFHLFMNHSVQFIPIVLPGSGPDGNSLMRFLNMLLCGTIFVYVAVQAREMTVKTQESMVELFQLITGKEKEGGNANYQQVSTSDKNIELTNNNNTVESGTVEDDVKSISSDEITTKHKNIIREQV
eukprot:CAMPEP_0178960642 /NCGR_PEP_ID=MMETSP0789-20121207/13088_1 /TAXON_ID=3005 /ORGANISM="Rhizosolenia setigera, Strain CCMP 1694" /LENGTH=432 /DNA_ID=CAMNT_0020644035 /DNA_START=214 /DNA_END=1512 /DNA_ORIENTATION=-